jgi:ketosteroid isomerase-like protein
VAQARRDAGVTSDVDRIRAVNEAIASSDFDTLSRLLDPDVVWEHNVGTGSPEEGVYRGRSDVLRLFERILDVWESLRAEPHEIRELGDGAYRVRGELRGKHAASATEVASPYEQYLEIRDGVLVKGRMTSGSIARDGEAEADAGASANVALIRDFTEAFNRHDIDDLTSQLDPEVELHEWPAAPGAGTYRGHDGVRKALDSWFEVWAWMHVEIVDVVEAEDRVMVTLRQRAKGKGSEVEVEIESFNVYTVRDGKLTRLELYTERESALEAAGLANQMSEEAR